MSAKKIRAKSSNCEIDQLALLRYHLKFAVMTPSEADRAEVDREKEVESVADEESDQREDEEEFVEAAEHLNESQTKELMEMLKRLDEDEEVDDAERTDQGKDCSYRGSVAQEKLPAETATL